MEILKNRIYELIKECQQIRDKEYNGRNYMDFDQDTLVYNNNINLICGLSEAVRIIKASEGNPGNSKNANCAIFDVSQQRELLINFMQWHFDNDEFKNEPLADNIVDNYLKLINCG